MIEKRKEIGKGERAIYDKWEASKELSMDTVEQTVEGLGWELGWGEEE